MDKVDIINEIITPSQSATSVVTKIIKILNTVNLSLLCSALPGVVNISVWCTAFVVFGIVEGGWLDLVTSAAVLRVA